MAGLIDARIGLEAIGTGDTIFFRQATRRMGEALAAVPKDLRLGGAVGVELCGLNQLAEAHDGKIEYLGLLVEELPEFFSRVAQQSGSYFPKEGQILVQNIPSYFKNDYPTASTRTEFYLAVTAYQLGEALLPHRDDVSMKQAAGMLGVSERDLRVQIRQMFRDEPRTMVDFLAEKRGCKREEAAQEVRTSLLPAQIFFAQGWQRGGRRFLSENLGVDEAFLAGISNGVQAEKVWKRLIDVDDEAKFTTHIEGAMVMVPVLKMMEGVMQRKGREWLMEYLGIDETEFRQFVNQRLSEARISAKGRGISIEGMNLEMLATPEDRVLQEAFAFTYMSYLQFMDYCLCGQGLGVEQMQDAGTRSLLQREFWRSSTFHRSVGPEDIVLATVKEAVLVFGGYEGLLRNMLNTQEVGGEVAQLSEGQVRAVKRMAKALQAQEVLLFYEANLDDPKFESEVLRLVSRGLVRAGLADRRYREWVATMQIGRDYFDGVGLIEVASGIGGEVVRAAANGHRKSNSGQTMRGVVKATFAEAENMEPAQVWQDAYGQLQLARWTSDGRWQQ